MSVRRLQQRVPSARVLQVAVLRGHRLAFHKAGRDNSAKCDAMLSECDQDLVHGVVYRIEPRHRYQLDKIEGLGRGYAQKRVALQLTDQSELLAFTYYATHIDTRLHPYTWYIEHVMRGAREHKLPDHYLSAIAAVHALEDPDRRRHATEMAVYHNAPAIDDRGEDPR